MPGEVDLTRLSSSFTLIGCSVPVYVLCCRDPVMYSEIL